MHLEERLEASELVVEAGQVTMEVSVSKELHVGPMHAPKQV